jgi:uncharacterized RDD family membrane protein YckC
MREPAFRASYPVAENRADPGPYATGRRLGAWLLDTVLVGLATAAVFHLFSDDIVRALVRADGPFVLLRALLALPAALVYGGAALAPAALGATLQTALAPALWVVLSVFYHGLAEHLFGKTLGQYRHGPLVARRGDRGRPTLSAAILRAAARPVDGLVFGLFGLLVSRLAGDGRRFGDLLAGTLVLDAAEAIRVLPTMDLAVARTRREIRAKDRCPPRPLRFEPPRREPPWENPGPGAAHAGPELLDAREHAERQALAALKEAAASMVQRGWRVFFDAFHPEVGGIPCVLISPACVALLRPAPYRGTVTAEPSTGRLLLDGAPLSEDLQERAAAQAAHVRNTLFAEGRGRVIPHVCLTRARIGHDGRDEMPRDPRAMLLELAYLPVALGTYLSGERGEGYTENEIGRMALVLQKVYGAKPHHPTPEESEVWPR